MNSLIASYKRVKIHMFNRRHHTNIRSLYANLDAKYGFNVRIDAESRIASDVCIGDFSYVNHSSNLECCDVGKFCSISSHVHINPYNHNLTGLTTHPQGDYKRLQKRVVIGNDVLISLNAVILESVHIGDGAVIGAGAVVTHDVGAYEIWGGVPARFIRYRVADKKIREYLFKLKWWDMPLENARNYIDRYRTSLNGIEHELAEGRDSNE